MPTRRRKKHHQESGVRDNTIRPFWSGTISFGLVSVPVSLFPASRRGGVPLRLLDESGMPVNRRYFCPEHDRDIHPEHIVRGFELDNGEYVVVRDEELEDLEPRKSQEIDLQRVVDRDEISPMLFDRMYYLTPTGSSNKAYRLLADVMERKNRAGIATFVMRNKEYLVAILAKNGILQAQTMRFQEDLRTPDTIGLPKPSKPKRNHVAQLERSIESHSAETLPLDELSDDHSEQLRALIERKRKAEKDVVEVEGMDVDVEEQADEAPETDLLETIRKSLHARGKAHARNGRHAAGNGDKTNPRNRRLEDESKSALYDRATKLKIEGRSHMTKRELLKALKEQ
jgi:DNA end-binding protein Ku